MYWETVMSNEWDDYAETWEQNPATAVFAERAFNELNKLVSLKGLKVLDFGCGTGLLAQQLSPIVKEIVALDTSEQMIEQLDAKELPNVEPVVDSLSRGLVAYHPAFRSQFDLIVASSVCGFVDDYEEIAKVANSLLNEGGLFVHWDWLAENDKAGSGLTIKRSQKALDGALFSSVDVNTPFTVETENGELTVLMGVAQK